MGALREAVGCPHTSSGRPPKSWVPVRVAFTLTGSLLGQPSRDAPRQLHPQEDQKRPGTVGLSGASQRRLS